MSSSTPRKILVRKPRERQTKKKINILTPENVKTITVDTDRNEWDQGVDEEGVPQNNEIDHHGYYLPPSTGRTIIVRKPRNESLYVDPRIPLPQPLTEPQVAASQMYMEQKNVEEPIVKLATVEDLKQKRILESAVQPPLNSQPIRERKIRKFISSLNKTGTASNFTFSVAEPLKRITKVKFVSVTISYVVPAAPPLNGFVYLDKFPLFENPSYYETGVGTKYSAHYPILSGTVGATVNFAYIFPRDYEMYLSQISDTLNNFTIKFLKEDPTTIPGDIVDFSDITYATLELEFYMENLVVPVV